ncbi:3-deoxy-D-manno-octulosonic acid transferase [Pleomorphomonas sp. T1.2MG-36]|uniref:3-deoxy-D-manno-octulosonic acid transferase n=1 Tax=Pleomorphomonas sp. T1.2MG-36 TaxID=3041167 RepID=UPI00247742E6|nr:3-deoxy-D-manno-octulosonic acid transferase [Pleomorphomonas sp. T1.2MG-36]CAI9409805.1 3-deoxy-D-manno-octulosonic acid transferase [Pleomorphomonas sp. T1.2MG-36]
MADLGDALLSTWIVLTRLAGPVGGAIVGVRRRRGKEDPARSAERLGQPSASRPEGPLVWVHAVSVGEAMAAMPVVDRLISDGMSVLVTTVTTTSAALVGHRLKPGLIHQFAPLDLAGPVDRFLAHWRPDLAVFVESEIWPVAIGRLADHGIPLVVANARLSPRSFRGWQRAAPAARAVFRRMSLVLAQTDDDGARFARLGAPEVATFGNIKFDAGLPDVGAAELDALKDGMDGRPMVLAASTHPGEDEVVLTALLKLKESRPEVLLVIVPRHPVRGGDIALLSEAAGLATRRRSTGELPDGATEVYVADTLGELATFFRLADVVLMGGTFIEGIGGHNLIEPARLGAAVVSGPHFSNWLDIYHAFIEAGGLKVVRSPDEIADATLDLIEDRALRARQAAAGERVVAGSAGAVARTIEAIRPLIGRPSGGSPC